MPRTYDYSATPMKALIKACLASRWKTNFIEHPSTREIVRRSPPELKPFLYQVLIVEDNPLGLLCSPRDKSDEGYFEIWRHIWQKNYDDPEEGGGTEGHPEPSPT